MTLEISLRMAKIVSAPTVGWCERQGDRSPGARRVNESRHKISLPATRNRYRYPRGESYLDIVQRVHAVILEMERCRERLVVVGHQGVLRVLYAYWKGLSREDAPKVSIPLNTVVKLTPETYGCAEERIPLLTEKDIMGLVAKHGLDTTRPALSEDSAREARAGDRAALGALGVPEGVAVSFPSPGDVSRRTSDAQGMSAPTSPSGLVGSLVGSNIVGAQGPQQPGPNPLRRYNSIGSVCLGRPSSWGVGGGAPMPAGRVSALHHAPNLGREASGASGDAAASLARETTDASPMDHVLEEADAANYLVEGEKSLGGKSGGPGSPLFGAAHRPAASPHSLPAAAPAGIGAIPGLGIGGPLGAKIVEEGSSEVAAEGAATGAAAPPSGEAASKKTLLVRSSTGGEEDVPAGMMHARSKVKKSVEGGGEDLTSTGQVAPEGRSSVPRTGTSGAASATTTPDVAGLVRDTSTPSDEKRPSVGARKRIDFHDPPSH